MTITCAIDWAESHRDVALVDEAGQLVGKRRITDDAEGYRRLLELLAEAGDHAGDPIPVAVETARGLVISCRRTTGRKVYSINPMAVARYRERHRVTRAKSDHADAMALANILRTDAQAHRPLPADSELVQAIAVLARAQQDAVWNRGSCLTSCARILSSTSRPRSRRSRSAVPGWIPARPAPFSPWRRTTGTAAKLSQTGLQAVLCKAGRQRNIDAWAERLRGVFAGEQLRQLPLVEQAMGRQNQALILQLDAACPAGELAAATAERSPSIPTPRS